MKRATTPVVVDDVVCDISIHALVKRATSKKSADIFPYQISIHALVKRATVTLF